MTKATASQDKMGVAGWGCLIVMLVLLGLMVWGIVVWVRSCSAQSGARQAFVERFEDHIDEYAGSDEKGTGAGGTDYIRGKLVMVCPSKAALEGMFLDELTADQGELPKSLLATSPAEVGTVVLVEWPDVMVGTYTDGAKAYRTDCEVTIIDFAKKTVVARTTLTGSSPPSEKAGSGDEYGMSPSKYEVFDYLKRLKRR